MDTISTRIAGHVLLLAIVTSNVILSFQQKSSTPTYMKGLKDGYPDLPDCSDEGGCKCSTKIMDRMDGEFDTCPLKLSPYTYDPTMGYDARAHGYLHVRFQGEPSAPLCIVREPKYYIDLARRHCGTINVTEIKDEDIHLESVKIVNKPMIPVKYWAILQNPTELEEFRLGDSCPANRVLRVTCPNYDSFQESPVRVNGNEQRSHSQTGSNDRQQRPRFSSHRDRGKRTVSSLSEIQFIVGGEDAAEDSFPFVGILVRNGKYFCMVIIISERWVLTAAHCIHGIENYYYEVVVGKFRRQAMAPYEQTHRVLGYKDAGFERETFKNDIALLKLATPLYSNRWIRYVTLTTTDPVPDASCFIAGWGALEFQEENPTLSNTLKMAELRIMNCTERLGALGVVCAGVIDYSKDSCQGDSGGPLVCQDQGRAERPWVLAGLVSYGFECAREGHTGGYTSIEYHLRWINRVIAGTDEQTLVKTKDTRPVRCHVTGSSLPCPELRCRKPLGVYLDEGNICNEKPDCLDGEDEQNCDYSHDPPMQVMGNPRTAGIDDRIPPLETAVENIIEEFLQSGLNVSCDHCPHLIDYSDEENCTLAQLGCQTNQIPCLFGSGCLERSERCSGKNVCSDGGGELGCVFLSKDENVLLDRFDLALPSYEGYPYFFANNEWKMLCVQDTTPESLQQLANVSCQYLGYEKSKEVHLEKKDEKAPNIIYVHGSSVYSHLHTVERRHVLPQEVSSIMLGDEAQRGDLNASEIGNIDSLFYYVRKTKRNPRQADRRCSTMLISCHTPLSGKVQLQMFSKNPSVHQPGAMPWSASVHRNGEFLCSATMILHRWAIASGSCSSKYDHVKDTVLVILGTNCVRPHRKGWGPYEQAIRVGVTFRNSAGRPEEQVALLKLDREPDRTAFVNSLHWAVNPQLQLMSVCATIWQQNIIELVPYNCTAKPWCLRPTEKDAELFHKIDEMSLVACRANKSRFQTWWAVGFVVPGAERFQILSREDYKAVINMDQEYGEHVAEYVDETDELNTGTDGSSNLEQPFIEDGSIGSHKIRNQTQDSGELQPSDGASEVDEVDAYMERPLCFHKSCPLGQFQCFNSKCIELSRVGDGYYDCSGGEDEGDEESLHCLKMLRHTNCTKLCDGYVDCPSDGIDEKYCGCPQNTFRCYMSPEMKGPKKCIQKQQVCDMCKNCDGGEDEKNCYTLAEEFRNQENVLGVWPTLSRGYVLFRTCGRWHTVPADKWNKTLSLATCNKIGLGTFIEAKPLEINITDKTIDDNSFRRLRRYKKNVPLDTKVESSIGSTNSSISHSDIYEIMYIKCKES